MEAPFCGEIFRMKVLAPLDHWMYSSPVLLNAMPL